MNKFKVYLLLLFLILIPYVSAQWINTTVTRGLYDAAGSGSIDDTRFFEIVNWSNNYYLFIGSDADDYANVYNVTSGNATLLFSWIVSANPYSLDGMRAVTVDDRGLAYWCARTDDTITVTNHTFLMQGINTTWYNVSNYTSSSGAGSVDGCYYLKSMKIFGGYYLVVSAFDDNQTTVINYTNPSAPVAVANYSTSLTTGCSTVNQRPFAIDNNSGFIFTTGYSNSTIGILNFTGNSLVCLNQVYNTTNFASVNYVYRSNEYLFYTHEGGDYGISVYNYTSNGSLNFMSKYLHDSASNYSITLPQAITIENNISYVARRGDTPSNGIGFVVFNVSDKYNLVPIGYYNTSIGTNDMNFSRDLKVYRGVVYLYSSGNDTFLIINGTYFNASSSTIDYCSYSGTGNFDISNTVCNITSNISVQSGFNFTLTNSTVYTNGNKINVTNGWMKLISGWFHWN